MYGVLHMKNIMVLVGGKVVKAWAAMKKTNKIIELHDQSTISPPAVNLFLCYKS